jgi:hypothetical protein
MNWLLDYVEKIITVSVFIYIQVQLLVSESDVENYKQIKLDLDDLRLIVEKSELWVFKPKHEEKKKEKKKEKGSGDEVTGFIWLSQVYCSTIYIILTK